MDQTEDLMKQTRLKTVLSLLLVLVMALTFGLAACTPTEDNPPQPGTTYNVIFNVNTDDNVTNEPDIQRVESGKTATEPSPAPGRDGYEFAGWYTTADCTTAFDFSTPITAATTLYAKWDVAVNRYTVTFDYQGGGTNTTATVEEGQTVEEPEEPVREGYIFSGWYLDAAGNTPYSFASAVRTDFTLYAKWEVAFTVTFDYNYEGAPAAVTQQVAQGQSAEEPEDPTRDGYVFSGWYTDAAATDFYDFGAVTEDITLYAGWADAAGDVYTVTFDLNYDGAEDIVSQFPAGSPIRFPQAEREGYRLEGWYTDEALTEKFESGTAVNANMTLYARWVDSLIVTFDYNYEGAAAPFTVAVDSGNPVEKPADPVRSGYAFAYWSDSANGGEYNFDTPVTSDLTLYAQWNTQYVFEAEDVDVSDINSWGFSGNATGTMVICQDAGGVAGASNGYYTWCLNNYGVTLDFVITSDRAVKDAELIVSLSAEIRDIYLTASGNPDVDPVYRFVVNGEDIAYQDIYLDNVPGQGSGEVKPFQDYVIGNIDLVEGENHIQLITANNVGQGGTMTAIAPMVDCIKVTTNAVLTFHKTEGQY